MFDLLGLIFGKKKQKNVYFHFAFRPIVTVKSRSMIMFMLKDTDKVEVNISFLDEVGNVIPVDKVPKNADGSDIVPKWTVSDPSILNLTVDSNGMRVVVAATGTLGTSQLNVSVDIPNKSGGVANTVAGLLDVEVIPSDIVTININPGTPSHI